VVAESLAQSPALWHVRESIPLAQAEEGLNIKHDIALPVSAIPASCAQTDAALQRAFPACGWSTSATWATATCTTTCRRPPGMDGRLPGEHEHAVNRLVYDAVQRWAARSRPSTASAQLKRDELARASRRWRWR
jgi:hypothetical protein